MNREHRTVRAGARLLSFAWLTVAAVYIVNLTGFVDTLTDSVTGCGQSWPLCHGALKPWTWDWHAWIEFGHRTIVLLMTAMVVALVWLARRRYGRSRQVRLWGWLALAGIAIESLFGALSVFAINPPPLMAAHLGVALLTFGALIALAVTLARLSVGAAAASERTPVPRRAGRWAWWIVAYLYADIYVGALVASTGSGGSFRGVLVPTESFAAAGFALVIDIAHRSLAVGMLVLVARLALAAFRFRRQRPDFYHGTVAAVALVVLQAFSGMYLIASQLSFLAVMLHVAGVSLLYGAVVYVGALALPHAAAGRRAARAPGWTARRGATPAAAPLGAAAADAPDGAAALPPAVPAEPGPAAVYRAGEA